MDLRRSRRTYQPGCLRLAPPRSTSAADPADPEGPRVQVVMCFLTCFLPSAVVANIRVFSGVRRPCNLDPFSFAASVCGARKRWVSHLLPTPKPFVRARHANAEYPLACIFDAGSSHTEKKSNAHREFLSRKKKKQRNRKENRDREKSN